MAAVGPIAYRLRAAPARSGGLLMTRRCLGDTVAGPPITDLAGNFKKATEFFSKGALTYAEYKQQCVSLRLFAMAGVTAGCTVALFLNPPKSSYWATYGPTYWFYSLKESLSSSAPPVFLSKKVEHEIDVPALIRGDRRAVAKTASATAAPSKAATPAKAAPAETAAPAAKAPTPTHSAVDLEELERRVAELETYATPSQKKQCVAEGAATHSAFVFIKPHAVTDKVKELVKSRLIANSIEIVSEGVIPAERIDKEQLIDTHYGAIAAKAVKFSPDTLTVQAKAQGAFESAFGMSWNDAVKKGLVFNAMDATKKLGITPDDLGVKWGTLKKDVNLLKFGGGFYCGKVDDIFVINGFYMDMRKAFTTPGTCIAYYEVKWPAQSLKWEDFRGKTLGGTDPKTAAEGSLRNDIYKDWSSLGLKSVPNTGDNGVHASASPLEALAERSNWLGANLATDYFGKAMLAVGVPLAMLKAWCDDPAVKFDGKKQSLFDLLEDLDGGDCLKKSAAIAAANK